MMNQKRKNGYTLLEALLAIAFASLFFVGATGLLLTSNRTSAESVMRQKALWRANQGIEALQSIAENDLVITDVGSLSFASNQWSIQELGPEVLDNGITRTVKVEEVERDSSCGLVEIGGDIDPDSHYLESSVSWNDLKGQEQTITLRTLRTNWLNPTGSCGSDDCAELTWDLDETEWYGTKQLREIYVTNNSDHEIVISKITPTWDYATNIQQIFFDLTKFWSSSGPGTPLGEQVSGTELTGENGEIGSGLTVEIPKTQFDENMEGSTITMNFECSDGSNVTVGPFTPES